MRRRALERTGTARFGSRAGLALLSAAVTASLVVAAGATAAARTPAALLAASLAAGKAQGSVHYVARARFGSETVTIDGDAATDRGRQQITFTKSGRSGRATVLVVNNTAYIKGDAFILTNYMQIPAALAGRWLSLAHTVPAFKPVAEAVRIGSTLAELKMTAPLRFVPGRPIAGTRTTGIRGKTSTLYVKVSKTPLPVEQVSSEANGASDTISFSRWKERVTVVAPAGATALR